MTPEQSLAKEMAATTGWRGDVYRQIRQIVTDFEPPLTLQWKWNSAIWSGKKDVISVSPFKEHFKINFFRGAHLAGFESVFNNGLESKNSRSIDFFEGDVINEELIRRLIAAAIELDSR